MYPHPTPYARVDRYILPNPNCVRRKIEYTLTNVVQNADKIIFFVDKIKILVDRFWKLCYNRYMTTETQMKNCSTADQQKCPRCGYRSGTVPWVEPESPAGGDRPDLQVGESALPDTHNQENRKFIKAQFCEVDPEYCKTPAFVDKPNNPTWAERVHDAIAWDMGLDG